MLAYLIGMVEILSSPAVLIVEDSQSQRYLLASLLKNKLGYQVIEAIHGIDALEHIEKDKDRNIAAILLDLEMPEMDGREALPKILALRPDLPVIVLTGTDSIRDVVDVMKLGAADFLVKPPDIELLKHSLQKALHVHHLEKEIDTLRRKEEGRVVFSDIIGQDGLKAPLKLAQRAAQSDITVLITGESGTGKEVFAKAIHEHGTRKDKPFIAVNCGAIPKDLIESTLFGHKKGAFTGAVSDAAGKFREADGGTLFLDEIGELPRDAQVKLLRALQTKEIEPVGFGKSVAVNVRIIAATNRNPLAEVKRGNLREDLYYRLNAFPIHLPPLRSRAADIQALSAHFIRRYSLMEKKPLDGIENDAMNWLCSHNWPGNVRELENALYRAVLMCEGEKVTLGDIIQHAEMPGTQTGESDGASSPLIIQLKHPDGTFKTAEEIRMEAMRIVLAAHDNHVISAANALGISKSTFYTVHKKQ